MVCQRLTMTKNVIKYLAQDYNCEKRSRPQALSTKSRLRFRILLVNQGSLSF